MSRLDEVEAEIHELQKQEAWGDNSADLARTLAAEVDARDEVIAKLLAMLLEEGGYSTCDCASCKLIVRVYARACEIAGRTE